MLYKTQTDYATMRKRLGRAAALTLAPKDLGDVYFEMGLASIFLGDPEDGPQLLGPGFGVRAGQPGPVRQHGGDVRTGGELAGGDPA